MMTSIAFTRTLQSRRRGAAAGRCHQSHAAGSVEPSPWSGVGASTGPSLSIGDTISSTQALGKNAYASNPQLMNSGWAHVGTWYNFQVMDLASVSIALTPLISNVNFAPGITLWASGNTAFDGGTESDEVAENGWGAPHSLNTTSQIGAYGTGWMSGANGNILQTVAYAQTGPSWTAAQTGWGNAINTGVNDVTGGDTTFASGISGTATGNSITMSFEQLAAGWYTVFVGGANNSLPVSTANYALSVSAVAAVPEPETYAMLLVGLGAVVAVARRRKQRG